MRHGIERLRTAHDLFKVLYPAALLEYVVESRDLDEPANVVAEELVLDDPLCKLVPLAGVAVCPGGQTVAFGRVRVHLLTGRRC